MTRRFPIAFWAALAASGCTPEPASPTLPTLAGPVIPVVQKVEEQPEVRFVDVTESAGIRFVHANGAVGAKLLPETMGSGVAFLDYDVDGDPDLFFVNSCPWPDAKADGPKPTQALYRNDGRGRFDDVTAEAGLALTTFGMGVAVGDYDNDGDPDLFLTALGGCRLFRNDGGKFVDVTAEANAGGGDGWWTSATFLDLENDGDLDLFACRYIDWVEEFDRGQAFQLAGTGQGRAYGPPSAFGGSLPVLLRNDGGKFVDISEESGVQVRSPELRAPVGKSLGVAPYDIDGDGLVDLAVANDTVPNFLFHNLGGGKFEEIGIVSGVAFDVGGGARAAMGIDWSDFKNDGTLGLAIGNFANEMTALYVSDDPKLLTFSDLANINGLGAPTQPPMKFGLFFFDYDLDGRPDLLSVNGHLESDIEKVQSSERYAQAAQLFWNTGRPGRTQFVLVGPDSVGPDLMRPIVGRGSAYADIDGDGDLDVVLTANGGPARLLRNDGGDRNRWVRIKLVGTKSNRDGLGARVEVRGGGVARGVQAFTAKGYLSAVERTLTFGLGPDGGVDGVTIRWPSGSKTELPTLEPGRTHTIREELPSESHG